MTEEQLFAEEKVCNGKCQDDIDKNYVHCKDCVKIKYFLAGLKAGRPQWHDLRKDPNDLPKDNNEVLVYMWDSYYRGYFNLNSWHFENFSEGTEQVDAWCEIPQFKE